MVSLFYEDSTRTRLSFETAAKRLSADTMTFSVATSSANKGESLRDTVETICAMGVDAIVVMGHSAGAYIAAMLAVDDRGLGRDRQQGRVLQQRRQPCEQCRPVRSEGAAGRHG